MADPPPSTTLSGGQIVNIYGYITRVGNLDVTGGSYINIYDTLVIAGNLTLANQGVVVHPGGLLIVLGDLTSTTSGGAKINNSGNIVVVGEFTHWEGTITGGTDFYIFDDTPFIDNSGGETFPNNTETEQDLENNDPELADFVGGLGVGCGASNFINTNQWICSGNSPSQISGNSISGGTYQWQASTTSATSGFSNITSATGQNFTPGTLTQNTWYRRRATRSSCSWNSSAVLITVMSSGGWTGASSSDWNTNSNWCNNTRPSSTIDAIIPVVSSNRYPNIGSAASALNLTINSGASVTISSNTLSVYGNFTLQGTISGSGTLAFTGSVQQTISGNTLTLERLQFNNISANSIVIQTAVTVRNTLTFTSGNVSLSGNTLMLGYDVNNRGYLSYTSGKFYNGNFTRWIRGWTVSETATDGDIGNSGAYLFPLGTSEDTRPITLWYPSSAPNPGGSITISHTGVNTTSDVNITDTGGPILRRGNSYWTISSGNGLSGGTFNVKAGGTGFGPVANLSHIRLMRQNSAIPSSTHVTATGSFTNFLARRSDISLANLTGGSLYVGSINNTVSPLPIRLLSLGGYFTNEGINVEWSTASEDNFDHFLLERSTNGTDFETITRISGRGGHNVKTTYSYLDEDALSGRYYYRLKSIDLDESYEYSKVIAVIADSELTSTFSLYPNPVIEQTIYIKINDGSTSSRFLLFDEAGKNLLDVKLEAGKNEIALGSNIKNGIYIGRVITSNGFRFVKIAVVR